MPVDHYSWRRVDSIPSAEVRRKAVDLSPGSGKGPAGKRLADRKLAYGLNWFAPTEPMASHLDDVMSTDSSPENLDAFRQHHAQNTGNRLLSALVDRVESIMSVAESQRL